MNVDDLARYALMIIGAIIWVLALVLHSRMNPLDSDRDQWWGT